LLQDRQCRWIIHRAGFSVPAVKDLLRDKVIVIVGGTTGLGLSAARACIAEGAKVVVVGRSDESLHAALAQLGDASAGITGDAVNPNVAPAAIDHALEIFHAFHGLYHVAGGSGRKMGDGPLHEITDEGWHATIDLNLTSLFNSNRAAVRQFLRQKTGGSVLNMGSVLGWSPSPQYFATHTYTATKSAIIGFTKSCAAYYAKQDIRFNVLAPALVETPMAQRAANDPVIQEFIARKQPLDGGRIGRPEDLDAAAVYFLSDVSHYVTGQVLAVDGGWSVSEGIS
jgi:NAD(P)-dependent dehydrogenase (short-subunit alcohol dehydrogenase family)